MAYFKPPTAVSKGGTGATDASGARTALGLGTIATQDANNVSISGGSVTGITDLAIADGGTAASTAENARISLGTIGILSTTTGIDGTAAATTDLYTVPGGKTAIITGAFVRLTATNTLTIVGSGRIGIGAGEADIFGISTFTSLLTTSQVFSFVNVLSTYVVGSAAAVIKFGITTPFTATGATLAVDLIGYLI